MTPAAYALLFFGALAGGFVSGLAGFGTALMALGIWLYVLPPTLAVPLVLICSVIAQVSTLPSIWKTIDFPLVWPFLIGGLAGVPLGTMLIAHADPNVFKLTIGVFLLVFPTRALFPAEADGHPLRRQIGRCRDRICRRHPGRSCRPVRPASDPVGQHARLGQGGAARRFPDLQFHHPCDRAVRADRQRPRQA